MDDEGRKNPQHYCDCGPQLAVCPLPRNAASQVQAAARNRPASFQRVTLQKGNLVFENLGCNKCHGSEGEGVAGSGQSGGVPRIASTSLALPAFIQLVRNRKASCRRLAAIELLTPTWPMSMHIFKR